MSSAEFHSISLWQAIAQISHSACSSHGMIFALPCRPEIARRPHSCASKHSVHLECGACTCRLEERAFLNLFCFRSARACSRLSVGSVVSHYTLYWLARMYPVFSVMPRFLPTTSEPVRGGDGFARPTLARIALELRMRIILLTVAMQHATRIVRTA